MRERRKNERGKRKMYKRVGDGRDEEEREIGIKRK